MNLPIIPTDNYYKFFAISGITIALAATLFFSSNINEIYDDLDALEAEVETLHLETTFVTKDKTILENKIASMEKSQPKDFISLDPDSAITEYFIKNITKISEDKSLRDYYEFLFKYEDKIIPQRAKIKPFIKEEEHIFKLSRDLARKNKQIEIKLNLCKSKNNRLISLSIVLFTLVILGSVMAKYGFNKWYKSVQKPSDEKLALELKKLREPKTD